MGPLGPLGPPLLWGRSGMGKWPGRICVALDNLHPRGIGMQVPVRV